MPAPGSATPVSTVASRLAEVHRRIEAACARVGRDPGEVALVAVSKGAPIEAVRAALDAGARDLGENRAADLARRAQQLDSAPVELRPRWHFIGHLQRNKVRDIAPYVATMHALDSERLVDALDAARDGALPDATAPLPCYLEVNVSGESSKSGVAPAALDALLAATARARHLEVIGLMTMAPFADPDSVRPVFRSLKQLADAHGLAGLSMGMTNDYEVAIEEGATIVRVGRAIFGERAT